MTLAQTKRYNQYLNINVNVLNNGSLEEFRSHFRGKRIKKFIRKSTIVFPAKKFSSN